MGRNRFGATSGQTGIAQKLELIDINSGDEIIVDLVCSCGEEVYGFVTGDFYCEHCDSVCWTANCAQCKEYNEVVDERQEV